MNEKTHVAAEGDDRTANNAVRHQYRVLSDNEKADMVAIKDVGADFLRHIETLETRRGPSRELSLAKTKVEEAVMWAVKHVTAALALAILVAMLAPGVTLAAEAGGVDLSPLVGEVVAGLGAVLVCLAGWALRRWTGIALSAEARATLDGAADRAAALIVQRYAGRLSLDTGNPAINDGVRYLRDTVPGAVKRLGASPEALEARVMAELAKRLPAS